MTGIYNPNDLRGKWFLFRNGQPRLMKTPANEFSIQTGHSPINNIRWPGKLDPYLDVANSSGDEETTVRKLRVSAIQ